MAGLHSIGDDVPTGAIAVVSFSAPWHRFEPGIGDAGERVGDPVRPVIREHRGRTGRTRCRSCFESVPPLSTGQRSLSPARAWDAALRRVRAREGRTRRPDTLGAGRGRGRPGRRDQGVGVPVLERRHEMSARRSIPGARPGVVSLWNLGREADGEDPAERARRALADQIHGLAEVRVAGSNPVVRSTRSRSSEALFVWVSDLAEVGERVQY